MHIRRYDSTEGVKLPNPWPGQPYLLCSGRRDERQAMRTDNVRVALPLSYNRFIQLHRLSF